MVVYSFKTSCLYLNQPIDYGEQNILPLLSGVCSFCTPKELHLAFQYVLKFSWAKNGQDQHWHFRIITESLPGAASNIKSCYPFLNSVDERDSALSLRPVQSFASCQCWATHCLSGLLCLWMGCLDWRWKEEICMSNCTEKHEPVLCPSSVPARNTSQTSTKLATVWLYQHGTKLKCSFHEGLTSIACD